MRSRNGRARRARTSVLSLVVLAWLCFAQPAFSAAAGAAGQPQQRLGEARALQQKGSLREAQRSFEALLPDLRARADRADLGAALNALMTESFALMCAVMTADRC